MRACILRTFLLGLAASALPALAEITAFGDWGWSDDEPDYYFAATAAEGDRFLGQYCYFDTGNCLYLLSGPSQCEPEGEYPALINTDAGGIHVTLVCSHSFEGSYVYMISPFEDVDLVVRQGTRIGIVTPLQSDQFEVVRFSLKGSVEAIDEMRSAAEKQMGKELAHPASVEIL